MKAIWSEENKFKAWLEVELCACEAWAELGVIPREDVQKSAGAGPFRYRAHLRDRARNTP